MVGSLNQLILFMTCKAGDFLIDAVSRNEKIRGGSVRYLSNFLLATVKSTTRNKVIFSCDIFHFCNNLRILFGKIVELWASSTSFPSKVAYYLRTKSLFLLKKSVAEFYF